MILPASTARGEGDRSAQLSGGGAPPSPLRGATSPSLRDREDLGVRDQFPGIGDWHYLDSAATAQKPQAVIDAIARGYGPDYATVHRGVYQRSSDMTQRYEAARGAAAKLIGGNAEEVVFTRGATANAKPELEIFADDVKCAHGATVGELDSNQLFYLGSRGLPPAEARALLLEGFVMGLWDSANEPDAIWEAARDALRRVVS